VKVHFDNVHQFKTGPGTFAQRLAVALFNSGHELVDKGPEADVSLVFIEPTGQPLAKKVVQRLDGIWFKPNEYEIKNRGIKALFDRADCIVFQSQFDHDMVDHWWGVHDQQKPYTIISNGVDLELTRVKEITIPKLAEMRAAYDQIYVCSSNWHPQKRLAANIKLFDHLRATQHPNSCLIVLGDHPDCRIVGPHIFYAGAVGPEVYMQIYSAANWMLHLAWADHCPNVIVEALSQGTPVVCSEVGGTKELIGHGAYGIVLKEPHAYNFELADYDNPPEIDVTQVKFLPSREDLDYTGILNIDINHVAQAYIELFASLI